ncbi:MAG: FadR/GntR family transcriptional regulator [Granulosicoccus sp.]
MNKETSEGALVQLRAYIAQGEFALNDRLPPERELCDQLGIARSELRKAFAVLESEGAIWRHVGRGTFVANGQGHGADFQSIAAIAKRTTPQQVMYARLVLEPQLAREAALHATSEHVEQLTDICDKSRQAVSWRQYETLDNRFHSLITEATQNTPLIAMYDQLNALRRTIVWGRLRRRHNQPPEDHHSFTEHEAILAAIEQRDTDAAQLGMRSHLKSVSASLFPSD